MKSDKLQISSDKFDLPDSPDKSPARLNTCSVNKFDVPEKINQHLLRSNDSGNICENEVGLISRPPSSCSFTKSSLSNFDGLDSYDKKNACSKYFPGLSTLNLRNRKVSRNNFDSYESGENFPKSNSKYSKYENEDCIESYKSEGSSGNDQFENITRNQKRYKFTESFRSPRVDQKYHENAPYISVNNSMYSPVLIPSAVQKFRMRLRAPPQIDAELRTLPCPHCPKLFKRKAHVKSHIQTHDKDRKRFSCHYCGVSFSFQSGCRRHEKTHKGTNIVRCHACLKIFHRQHRLNLHISAKHPELVYSMR